LKDVSYLGSIGKTEAKDLLLSLIALTVAFSIVGERRLPEAEVFLISAIGVGTGFLLHEMAHKFAAQRYGYWAEYRANFTGLIMVVILAFAGFIFAAPGAVMIRKISAAPDVWQGLASHELLEEKAKREELVISLAGPMTNIVLVFFFFLLMATGATKVGLGASAASFALFINLSLAAFNLLPFGPLDGKKVFDSNRMVWAIVALPTILATLSIYLGLW
jgi:Zn-dependent protease